MKDLVKIFNSRGYVEVGLVMFGVTSLFTLDDGTAYVVNFIDKESLPSDGKEIYSEIEDKVVAKLAEQGYNQVRQIKIIMTEDVPSVDAVLGDEKIHWYIDKNESKLIIPDNQPIDFRGIRRDINDRLENVTREKPKAVPMMRNKIRKASFNGVLTVTNLLVLSNVIVYIITAIGGDVLDAAYINKVGGLSAPSIMYDNEWYRLLTCMFLHFGFRHLVNNMFLLFIMGNVVERNMGTLNYIYLYFAAGLASSFSTLIYYKSHMIMNSVSAGASGAIFGVVGGMLALLILKREGQEIIIRFFVFILFSIASGLLSGTVNNVAHISGAISGFVIAVIICVLEANDSKRKKR